MTPASKEKSVMLADPFDPAAYEQLLDRLEIQARDEATRQGADWNVVMGASDTQPSVQRQALTVLMLGLFDSEYYLATYPDIAACGADALMHYVQFGDKEGRWPNAHFNPTTYRKHFAPGALEEVCALYHYAVFGEDLGLDSPTAFSPRRYLQSNPELQAWVDRPLAHFLHLGKPAGLVLHHRIRLSSDQNVDVPKRAVLSVPAPLQPEQGINVVGPLDKISGLGVSARGYLEGLRLAGAPRLGARAQQREFPRQSSLDSDHLSLPEFIEGARVNIVHMNGDTLPMMLEHGGDALFQGTYNIAVWYWELPNLRPEWQVSMKYFHEFWAPTPFIAETLRRSTAKRVTLLPPYLAYLNDIRPESEREGGHNFVYCFDANSILERKNPRALLDAFQMAFPPGQGNDDVHLTFKITYPDHENPEVKRLYEAAANDSRVRIIDYLLSDEELHHLIGTASAYVSPHRSEGLGLTVVEAMGAEVPVITISFGGLSHFISPDTAWPVRYHRVELPADYFPYPQGFVWADPDVDSLAENLRFVLESPEEVKCRAMAARERVLDYFCSDRLVDAYRAELDCLKQLGQ
ncbi:MAG: glycosyltransferase family 4 protein [Hydrogenophaga sp.]|nr:glycosyltransferase family 4 protein [Hydrogenophaga sp.]